MNTQNRNNRDQQTETPCFGKDKDNPTQISINKERRKYCNDLYEARGKTSQQETKFRGENDVFIEKKCLFIKTEENYLRYRNLDILIGTEILQTADSIKGSVDKFKKWNTDLSATLKKINKSIKEVKTKFSDLKDAGCRLESSIKDQCNKGQWRALTGKTSEKCNDKPGEPHPDCKEAARIIEELICRPKGLIRDVDSLFQSSADVIGIQVFSNTDMLEPLQKDLDTYAKDLQKHINAVVKVREGDMKNLQTDLVNSVKEITKSAMERNSLRSDFEGHYDALRYLCCPPCDCVVEPKPGNDDPDCGDNRSQDQQRRHGGQGHDDDRDCYNDCKPRLEECEDRICKICDEVDEAFCCEVKDPDPSKPPKPPRDDHRGCCD